MDQVIVITLTLLLLSGFNQGQNLLPPGPVNGLVDGSVYFETITLPEQIESMTWSYNEKDVIKFTPPDTEDVHLDYTGRVNLSKSTGALELKSLAMADAGVYTLNVTSGGVQNQDHILLQVFEPVFGAAITSSEGILIENQSSVNLTCDGNGTITTTEWMREDQILLPNSNIMFLNNNRSVMINPVRKEDNGQYRCTISNPNSSSTAEHRITINYGPYVNILGTKTLEEGADILLLCSPDSVPPATITWTVNDMSAGSEPLYITENSSPSHSGNYICKAWNNVTSISNSAIHKLTVKSKSFKLSPGAAAGIAVGVILGVEVLAMLLFFLIMYFKRPAEAAMELKHTKPSSSPGEEDGNTVNDKPYTITLQRRTPSPPIYENYSPISTPKEGRHTQVRVKQSISNPYATTLN